MKKILFTLIILCTYLNAENYLLNGGQKSRINYKLIERIQPVPGTLTVNLTVVEPDAYQSPTYNQEIENFNIKFSENPSDQSRKTDRNGNTIVKYTWSNPQKAIDAEISFTAVNSVTFQKVETNAPFPVKNLPAEIKHYTQATNLVQADHPKFTKLAQELTANAKTEYEAVRAILKYIIEHMNYVLTPPEYDAVWSLDSGKGNCQNYSHLAAALMRSAGIPVRIVNGITLKEPYDIKVGNRTLTMNMAEGRHSWIEVYFPDLGWMQVDPQQTELFVSNRFIRIETGLDNDETVNDGLVGWTRQKGSNAIVSFQETIQADFSSDRVDIQARPINIGIRKLLLSPEVGIELKPVAVAEKPEKPEEWSFEKIKKLTFMQPFIYGNLEFPENVNFAFTREIKEMPGQENQLQKNFLVETAEYITGQHDYAQVFVLEDPVQIQKIALALQNYGGSGKIWLELHEDSDGVPAESSVKSTSIDLSQLSIKPGYRWIDFDFSREGMVLTPGRYWVTLGYSGTPIINWFYTYGKTVGPVDGTRYKKTSEKNWDKTLGFEFNYRVSGLRGK